MSATGAPATARWRDWSCAVSVTVDDARHLDGAAGVVRDLMTEVDAAVSRFRPDSDLARINGRAGVLVPVRPLTLHLVTVALDAARDTRGAVDPTVGSALVAIGYDADIDVVRRRSATQPPGATSHRGTWRAVAVDRALRRVGVPAGAILDLGATAKAWTADEAARRVHQRYGGAVLVGLGGDLSAAGTPSREWRIDVSETESGPAVRLGLSYGGLATSSTTGRRWAAADGSTLHHVVDPRTGLPAAGGWRTATVWAPSALAANVVSTWALVDADAARRRITGRGLAARLVGHDGSVTTLGGWPGSLEGEVA